MRRTILLLSVLLSSVWLFAQVKHTAKKSVSKPLAASVAAGKLVYTRQCITCHMADGLGVQNMNPPLVKTTYVLGDKTRLIKIVLEGFNEDVDIDGQSYHNNMPAHNFLNDDEIADVLTYVRNNFTNKASAVTASEVRKVRAAIKPVAKKAL